MLRSSSVAGSAAKVVSCFLRGFCRPLVRPDLQKWDLSVPLLADLCVSAVYPRTRERLMALLLLAQQPSCCASRLCLTLGRDVHTVLKWVHDFNARGLSGLAYRHTGGCAPGRSSLAPLLDEVLTLA